MAGLEGTLKTPLGTVQKKTAVIVAGGALLLFGIVYYRQKQLDSEVVIPEAEINPATGYPYGSPEDAAALADQAGYVSPPTGGGNTGGGSGYPSNTGYVNNGQWVQAVIEYLTGNGLVEEPSQLSAALGKYITGAYCTDTDVGLIQMAIAVQGFPPVAAPSGYPPSINRTNPSPPPNTTPTTPKAPKLSGKASDVRAALNWTATPGAQAYTVHVGPASQASTKDAGLQTSIVMYGLQRKHTYTFSVYARLADGKQVKSNVITLRTT